MRGRHWPAATLISLVAVAISAPAAHAGLYDSFIEKSQGDVRLQNPTLGVQPDAPAAPYISKPLDKLSRGVTNLLSSPLEIPSSIGQIRRARGWPRALIVGPCVGLSRFVVRLASGAVDIVTFPVPVPHQALWVQRQSLFYDPSDRSAWVLEEAETAQRDLSHSSTIDPRGTYTPRP